MTEPSDPSGHLLAEMRRASAESEPPGQNHATFIALRDEIAEALAGGYTVKAVWRFLQERNRIRMTYVTFLRHCRAGGLKRVTRESQARPKLRAGRLGSRPADHPQPAPRRFIHNPTPDPKKLYGE